MSVRLRELIRLIRNAKTAEEERSIIAKECAAIRASFKDQDPRRARSIAKLMYIHMLGYPTQFGQMETINLIVSSNYPEKRIGYLALMILLDETQEVLPLIEHSLKTDLADSNQFVQALALTAMANIASEDICRDLSPEVESLLGHSAYVRKKAALCATRITAKCPELVENYLDRIEQSLQEKNHGVLLTTVTLITEIVQTRKKWKPHFRKMVPTFVKILKGLLVNSFSIEHDVNGVADPFLQCAILRLLRILARGNQKTSESITDILVQVTTNTEGSKNAGNSILYECVRTILDIPGDQGLRNLATNQLGKFLTSKDNNLRSVALQMLTRVIVDLRDHAAVNRHINTIVECLKDHDVAIKTRALELISVLFNHQNIKFLANELIGYLQVTPDGPFKEGLATKLCAAVEQYATSNEYQIATLLRVITLAGQYVQDSVAYNFIGLVTQTPQLHQKITKNLFQAVESLIPKPHLLTRQQTLVQVTVWCLGEYADLIVEEPEITVESILNLMTQLLESTEISAPCRQTLITSVAKLSERFPQLSQHIQKLILRYKNNNDVEIQQRSVEFSNLFQWSTAKSAVLDKMPPMPLELINRITQEREPRIQDDEEELEEGEEACENDITQKLTNGQVLLSLDDIVQLDNGSEQQQSKPQPQQGSNLLLDLFDDHQESSAPSANGDHSTKQPSSQPQPLESLLGFDDSSGSSSSNSSAPTLNSNTTNHKVAPSIDDIFNTVEAKNTTATTNAAMETMTVLDKDGLAIEFDIRKPNPSVPTYQIVAFFSNKTSASFDEFDNLAAVPKYIEMQIFKPSSSTIPINSEKRVHQKIKLTNTMHGTKPLAMKFRVQYKRSDSGAQVTEQGNVTDWPQNF